MNGRNVFVTTLLVIQWLICKSLFFFLKDLSPFSPESYSKDFLISRYLSSLVLSVTQCCAGIGQWVKEDWKLEGQGTTGPSNIHILGWGRPASIHRGSYGAFVGTNSMTLSIGSLEFRRGTELCTLWKRVGGREHSCQWTVPIPAVSNNHYKEQGPYNQWNHSH